MICKHLITKNISSQKLPNSEQITVQCQGCKCVKFVEKTKDGGEHSSRWQKQ